ncbi:MAG: HAD family hydrolase, partial [Streptomycetaceae bacterium]|nr:HAD family hydrolase [Streptomycetaceae bacterium]
IAADLRALLGVLPRAERTSEGAWRCGPWTARVDGGELALTGTGDAYDALRAACAAVWDAGGAAAVDLDRAAKTLAGLGL